MGWKFRRQHPIFHDLLGKETFYVVDFYCAELKLALELDGLIHIGRKEKDQARTEILNLMGVFVLRFANKSVEETMNLVLADIRKTIERLAVRTSTEPTGSIPFSSQEKD